MGFKWKLRYNVYLSLSFTKSGVSDDYVKFDLLKLVRPILFGHSRYACKHVYWNRCVENFCNEAFEKPVSELKRMMGKSVRTRESLRKKSFLVLTMFCQLKDISKVTNQTKYVQLQLKWILIFYICIVIRVSLKKKRACSQWPNLHK